MEEEKRGKGGRKEEGEGKRGKRKQREQVTEEICGGMKMDTQKS